MEREREKGKRGRGRVSVKMILNLIGAIIYFLERSPWIVVDSFTSSSRNWVMDFLQLANFAINELKDASTFTIFHLFSANDLKCVSKRVH